MAAAAGRAGRHADFTIYLATPASRDRLCGGTPDSYTSCRNGSNVVLNVARWANAVPNYGAPLDVYRQYMVTHETGHRLGQGHELCPGAGRPAPVMEQQTLGLHGCVPNPWPFPDGGAAYAGPSGEYDDPIPAGDSVAALQGLDVVAERPALRAVPVDRPGHQALEARTELFHAWETRLGRHVPAARARLGGQAGNLLVVGHLDRGALHDQALVQAVVCAVKPCTVPAW